MLPSLGQLLYPRPLSANTEQRNLAAIMFTDMVGYSALAQRGDNLALELLEEHRRCFAMFSPASTAPRSKPSATPSWLNSAVHSKRFSDAWNRRVEVEGFPFATSTTSSPAKLPRTGRRTSSLCLGFVLSASIGYATDFIYHDY